MDLGVRSVYVAKIDGDRLSLVSLSLKIHKQSRSEELGTLYEFLSDQLRSSDGLPSVYVEEPPLAGTRNLRTFLHLSQTSGVVGAALPVTYVPVSSWKKGTVGNGSASKELVANWLRAGFPGYHAQCGGDQNYIDATCIAIYGKTMG